MTEPKGKIFTNVLHYMAGQGAIAVFGLVTSIVLARYLPKDVFGQYSYLLSLAIIFLPLLDLGGHTLYAVLGARDRSRIGSFWARTIALKVYALPLTALVLAGYYYWSTRNVGLVYLLVLLYTVAQSLFLSTDVVFRPAEQGRAWAIRRVLFETASFFLVAVAVAFFHVHVASTLLLLVTIAVFVAVIWAVFTVVSITNLTWAEFLAQFRKPFDRAEVRALWPFALNTALWVFYYRETNLFLENFGAHAKTDLADYRVSYQIMTSALYIPKAVIWASVPRIAFHDEQENLDQFHALVRETSGINTWLATFFTVGGLLYGERLIGLVFGPKYAHLGLTWTLFDIVMGLLFVQQFCTDLLNGIRQERAVVYGLVAGIVILTTLSYFLVPLYGAAGAGAAQIIAGAVMVPMNFFAVARRVGWKNLHGIKLWRLALVSVVVAAIGFGLMKLNFYLAFYVSAVVFVAVFGALSYLLGALPEQFAVVAARLARRAGLQH
ncbi:MAG TPA: oligosaccharide flippase family protein [Rhizomicrobium sp.]|jgi:O-antigen/teichoic acid export membrane protein